MRDIFKKHGLFISIFSFSVVIFLAGIVFLRKGFLTGDNISQAYPWLKVYSEFLKDGSFPYWVKDIHCGFPLMGEGQVGGFYPLNILFFYVLPFRPAYNFIIIFHYMLLGTFTYLFTRKLGADEWGGTLAAIILCFGETLANLGYHVAMLRALTWFPLVLLLFEHYLEKGRLRYMVIAALAAGTQLLSGSVQMASYSMICYFFYLSYAARIRKRPLLKTYVSFAGFAAIAAIMFLPQLLLTLKVLKYSGRLASLDFSLWGSLNPLSFLTTVFPWPARAHGQIATEGMFLGVLSILFLIVSVRLLKEKKEIRPLVLIAAVSVFAALGWFNPFYVLALKVSKFYFFRGGARFIFFGLFSASVLAGIGFSRFFSQRHSDRLKQIKSFYRFILFCAVMIGGSVLTLIYAKPWIIKTGHKFVDMFIAGMPYHRRSLEEYYLRVENVYQGLLSSKALTSSHMLLAALFVVSAVIYCAIAKKYLTDNNSKKYKLYAKSAAIMLILANLYAYKYFPGGINDNLAGYNISEKPASVIYGKIKEDKDEFRVAPYGIRSGKLPFWIMPNMNMIYGVDSIGVYSPLSGEGYKKALEKVQMVDDSVGLLDPKEGALDADTLSLLGQMNVKYLMAPEAVNDPMLAEVSRENGVYLYRLKDFLGKGFFSADLNASSVSGEGIKVVEYSSGYAELEVDLASGGYIVFSEWFFPGWTARIDGKNVKIEPFKSVLQAVRCSKGKHRIVFTYRPF
ncbi:MAG: YfhO family protein [Candidatus Omnitrophota bacterium]